ncbi:MAG: sulfotransferase [Nitrosomonas sp.]|nr:sulfotransferase [Nitrosomonas sp.]MDP1949777.1 sulfotransferase [Nitrosomonas sp.]
MSTIEARRRLADDIGRTKSFWQVNGKTPLVLADFQLDEPGFAGVIQAIFNELASREGQQRWGEKSPMNLQHITALAKVFPNAQFIHIIRDVRDYCLSINKAWGKDMPRAALKALTLRERPVTSWGGESFGIALQGFAHRNRYDIALGSHFYWCRF